jgi:hypothetical protein
MKKTLLFGCLLVVCTITAAFAQYEGKRFVSANAGVSFSNNNPDEYPSTNGYGYNFDASFGKFKTSNMARGWSLSSSLSGAKNFSYYNGDTQIRDGLTGFGVGAGYFWQYYKHFNDKFGIFGGPNIGISYSYGKTYGSPNADSEQRTNSFSLPFSVSGGAYYTLNERWWLTASLGFANLFSVGYTVAKTENQLSTDTFESKAFEYKFSPTIALPSVSLGLRYFFRN